MESFVKKLGIFWRLHTIIWGRTAHDPDALLPCFDFGRVLLKPYTTALFGLFGVVDRTPVCHSSITLFE